MTLHSNQAKEAKFYHCSKCNNMLAKSKNLIITKGTVEIKCSNCGTFNLIK